MFVHWQGFIQPFHACQQLHAHRSETPAWLLIRTFNHLTDGLYVTQCEKPFCRPLSPAPNVVFMSASACTSAESDALTAVNIHGTPPAPAPTPHFHMTASPAGGARGRPRLHTRGATSHTPCTSSCDTYMLQIPTTDGARHRAGGKHLHDIVKDKMSIANPKLAWTRHVRLFRQVTLSHPALPYPMYGREARACTSLCADGMSIAGPNMSRPAACASSIICRQSTGRRYPASAIDQIMSTTTIISGGDCASAASCMHFRYCACRGRGKRLPKRCS